MKPIALGAFIAWCLTFAAMPIIEGEPVFLWFILLPLVFILAIIRQVLIARGMISPEKAIKSARIFSILSVLFGSASAGSIYVWSPKYAERTKRIGEYPMLNPGWFFIIMFTTVLVWLMGFAFGYGTDGYHTEPTFKISMMRYSAYTIAALIFAFIGMLASFFVVKQAVGTEAFRKELFSIGAVTLVLILICLYSAFKEGLFEKNALKDSKPHMENTQNVLDNVDPESEIESMLENDQQEEAVYD